MGQFAASAFLETEMHSDRTMASPAANDILYVSAYVESLQIVQGKLRQGVEVGEVLVLIVQQLGGDVGLAVVDSQVQVLHHLGQGGAVQMGHDGGVVLHNPPDNGPLVQQSHDVVHLTGVLFECEPAHFDKAVQVKIVAQIKTAAIQFQVTAGKRDLQYAERIIVAE